MKSTRVYLSLGSNLGDRAENLRAACQLLAGNAALKIEAKSKIYETQSVEGGGDGDFLNAALRVRWEKSAEELLQWTQKVEEKLGRPAPPRRGARTVDIDILLFGQEKINLPDLQIPHPRMTARAFVLRPLCDVLESEGWLREYSRDW